MGVVYRCPGTVTFGRRTERTVHGNCCAQFALMDPERRKKIGVRHVEPGQLLAVEPDASEPLTGGELIEVVRLLQLADDDRVTAPVAHVQYLRADHGLAPDQLAALLELGRAYGLQVQLVRPPQNSRA